MPSCIHCSPLVHKHRHFFMESNQVGQVWFILGKSTLVCSYSFFSFLEMTSMQLQCYIISHQLPVSVCYVDLAVLLNFWNVIISQVHSFLRLLQQKLPFWFIFFLLFCYIRHRNARNSLTVFLINSLKTWLNGWRVGKQINGSFIMYADVS